MLLLILTVCLAKAPATCEQTKLQFVDVSMIQCMASAAPYLAQWSEDHPGHLIKKYRCEIDRGDSPA